jgi:hypothetical protein
MAQSTPLFVGLDVHKDSIRGGRRCRRQHRAARVCRAISPRHHGQNFRNPHPAGERFEGVRHLLTGRRLPAAIA